MAYELEVLISRRGEARDKSERERGEEKEKGGGGREIDR